MVNDFSSLTHKKTNCTTEQLKLIMNMENAKGGIQQLRPKTEDQIPEMPLDYIKLPPSPFGQNVNLFTFQSLILSPLKNLSYYFTRVNFCE